MVQWTTESGFTSYDQKAHQIDDHILPVVKNQTKLWNGDGWTLDRLSSHCTIDLENFYKMCGQIVKNAV